MRFNRITIFLSMAFCCMAICHAQKIDTSKARAELDDFINSMTSDFDNFRIQIMSDFTDFVRNPWKEFNETAPVPKPNQDPMPPIINDNDAPINSNPIIIDNVIEPIIENDQPNPIQPIEESPVISSKYIDFILFGTPMKVRISPNTLPTLKSLNERDIADALTILANDENDNTIRDCLKLRSDYNLSDWAYLKMLQALSKEITSNNNDAALFLAYLYMQSGYKMRLATDGYKLYVLYASKHMIFDLPSFYVDGERYYGIEELPARLSICQASFPQEKPLSLLLTTVQKFNDNESEAKSRKSKRYPNIDVSFSVNKNLIDFYSTYPTSCLDGDIMTRWSMYANTPMDDKVATKLYPSLRSILSGKSEYEAVNMLLNFVQTGFEYEYDDKIWGCDRAFFAEESLYYPYCDCEDRSILLTRLVRDLLGLKCLLVYYPGHMACAIGLEDSSVNGDYLILNGKKYIVADPTYINAPLGQTMPEMDNKTANVIILN